MTTPPTSAPPADLTSLPQVKVLADSTALFEAATQKWIQCAEQAVADHGRFTVALAGGSTPRGLYSLLAGPLGAQLPWDQTYFFFGDERHVPPDHPDSNYRMAMEALLSKVPVPEDHIFRMRGEIADAAVAASQYESQLRSVFSLSEGQLPSLDLILLGMGTDGHTASLFPATTALKDQSRLVVANWVEKFSTWRITLTYPVLNHAQCVLFLVAGADKTGVLHRVLATAADSDAPMEEFPSRYVRPQHGELIWLMDRAAAGESLSSIPDSVAVSSSATSTSSSAAASSSTSSPQSSPSTSP